MTEHKAWAWEKVGDDRWLRPSEESYYLLDRWRAQGRRDFLDLGCGLGRHALQFARSGFSVSAFDLSDEGLRRLGETATAEGLAIDRRLGDMTALPYPDRSFDCLLAYHVISHTDTPGIKKAVTEITRVLRPDGEFYLTLCSKNARGFREAGFPVIDENTVRRVEDGPEDGIPHFFADPSCIEDIFRDLRIIDLRHEQQLVVDGQPYGSWHYFMLGSKG
jgi:SAM-dependent methyltransferase